MNDIDVLIIFQAIFFVLNANASQYISLYRFFYYLQIATDYWER